MENGQFKNVYEKLRIKIAKEKLPTEVKIQKMSVKILRTEDAESVIVWGQINKKNGSNGLKNNSKEFKMVENKVVERKGTTNSPLCTVGRCC